MRIRALLKSWIISAVFRYSMPQIDDRNLVTAVSLMREGFEQKLRAYPISKTQCQLPTFCIPTQ